MRLAGKTIVVTGGSSGLGRAMSIAFAREGADVVIGDIRETPREGGTRTDRLIAERGGSAVYVEADTSRSDDIGRLVSAAVERGGRLDVLVNNAIVAGRHSKGLLETDEADWDAIMAVGCRGVFLCCKRAVRQMLTQEAVGEVRGRIINISSQHGMVGTPGHVAYCAAKGAVVNLTRQLAVDFARRGIMVNAIAPGKILTHTSGRAGYGRDSRILAFADAVPAAGGAGRRRASGDLDGLRRVHLRERHQRARRRRVDGVLGAFLERRTELPSGSNRGRVRQPGPGGH